MSGSSTCAAINFSRWKSTCDISAIWLQIATSSSGPTVSNGRESICARNGTYFGGTSSSSDRWMYPRSSRTSLGRLFRSNELIKSASPTLSASIDESSS